MPELPEVETIRRHLDKALKNKRLSFVKADAKDHIVFDKNSPKAVEKALKGARVTGTGRKGKYFWLELDRRPWVVIHLGMTGNAILHLPEARHKSMVKRRWAELLEKSDEAPRFCRLHLRSEDGTEVYIVDPRRFGRIRLAQDPLHEKPIANLGFDPFLDLPPLKTLRDILAKRRAPIKAVLLDQGLFAGVGNYLADEILFQAKIAPQRLASSLNSAEVGRIRSRLHSIVKKAIQVEADYNRFPKSWLFHDRWGKKKNSFNSRGYEIEHLTIGGRTTAWVPALQK